MIQIYNSVPQLSSFCGKCPSAKEDADGMMTCSFQCTDTKETNDEPAACH